MAHCNQCSGTGEIRKGGGFQRCNNCDGTGDTSSENADAQIVAVQEKSGIVVIPL